MNTKNNDGWISIKDGLPQSKENVLCFYKFEPESPNVIADNVYFGNGVWMNETDKVTHWMPLPEPPKEE